MSWLKSLIIARYTFKEMLKSKILWNVVILGLGVACATFVATEFTFGVPTRVAMDLGLASLSLSSYAISLLIGINLIRNEEESRTIYLIISRPVSRSSFLVGKVVGVIGFLFLNLGLLSLVTTLTVVGMGGKVSPLAVTAMVFIMLEAVMLLLVVVLFSLISNRAIALMGSILLLVGGHAVGQTIDLQFVINRPWLKEILDLYYLVLPGFHRFNLKNLVLYETSLETLQTIRIVFYWLLYCTGLLSVSVMVLNRKNLD